MELNKFTMAEILNLNVESKEIGDWSELCNLNAVSSATLLHVPDSILERFIQNYLPEKYRLDHLNMVFILCFGFVYFNKEKILDENIHLEELKKSVLKEKLFYDNILHSYFQDTFNDYGENNDPVEGTIKTTFKNLCNPKNDAWLRIKKDYESLKMKDYLEQKLENKVL